jgi:hypothetical protein
MTLMNRITRNPIVVALAGCALSGAFLAASAQEQRSPRLAEFARANAVQEQKPHTRAEFMRMKLDFSKKVLEGLTLEDYDAIIKSAKALKRLSEAAEWEVPTIPNASDYVVFTTEFQRLADEMAQKAKDKNIDGATLAYLRLTMNCVNCHKYVRQTTK